jgi:hypothetical protein
MERNAPITTAEAGTILGVSAMTVRRATAEPGQPAEPGQLQCLRKLPGPNGDYLYDPAEVERFKAERDQAKAPATP